MTDLNKVILIGRNTHEINDNNFGYLPSGMAKLNISIAVNRSVKKEEQWQNEASFFDVVIFGKQAESLKTLITKGKQIAVSGSLKQDRWEKDGQKFSKVYIVADSVQLIGASDVGGMKKEENNSGFVANHLKPENMTAPAENIASANEDDFPF